MATTAVLAMGLPGPSLGPGMPLPELGGAGRAGPAGRAGEAAVQVQLGPLVLALLAIGAAALVGYALFRLLQGVAWREVAAFLLRGALGLGLAGVGVALLLRFVHAGPSLPPALLIPADTAAMRTPLGQPPGFLRWLAAGALAACAALLLGALLRARPPTAPGDSLLDRLALEADRARRDLLAGTGAGEVVLTAYARMSEVVAAARGVERREAMTAREFVAVLASLGLPCAPVEELTSLFEAVRYGGRGEDPRQQARALACLEAIVTHCRRGGET